MSVSFTQCPECGWTGQESDLEVSGSERLCPACDLTMKRV